LAARRVLVVAPHPDDEAIAAWGLMRRLHSAGAKIEVVVVSDGGASHPGSATWPVERLVAARRRETRQAMRALGLPRSAIRFMSLADGALHQETTGLAGALRRVLLARAKPDLLVGPEATDDHGDHRAVALALHRVPRRGEQRITYHVWPEGAATGARPIRIRLDEPARAMKRRIVRGYRSQAGSITDAPTGFTMTHGHLKAFAGPQECFGVQA
jgi:LmbE family N-acetylglucosaminyl deacetylase